MRELLRAHRVYFLGFLLFLAAGSILLSRIEHGEEIFFLSSYRTASGDLLFRYMTRMGEEAAYVLFAAVLLFVRYRYVLLLPVTGLVVTLVSALTKWLFAHPRPGAFLSQPEWVERVVLIDGVDLYSGLTSFPSGHTMSAFALYTVLALSFRKGWVLDLLLLLLAVAVGFSRIYLVQHFLKDVVMGAAFGVMLGVFVFWLQNRLLPFRPERWYDDSLIGPAR